jgi:F-type H+-transporting ATPase subunit delta
MSQTADRYAKALFDLAQEQHNLELVQGTMSDLRKLMINLPDFRLFLKNPLLSYEDRCVILKNLFEGKVPELAYRFLLFITYKGRLDILKNIIESFDSMYLSSTSQMRAYVKTALPINDADKGLINDHMKDKFHQQVLTQWTLDPSLIGGFRIFAQGKIYDYSFKNQLSHFFQQSTQPA